MNISAISEFLNRISGGNEMIAGAISLWAMGVATMLLKGLPSFIWGKIVSSMTTTLTLNNAGWENKVMANIFYKWMNDKISTRFTRSLSMERHGGLIFASIGFGNHIMFYKGRIVMINKSKLDSGGSDVEKESVTLTIIGRSHEFIHGIADEINKINQSDSSKNYIYIYMQSSGWHPSHSLPNRSMSNMAMHAPLREQIRSIVKNFSSDEFKQRCTDCGIPYKLTIILEGPPGTGKTSIIRSLAHEFNRNLCLINLGNMSDSDLQKAIMGSPSRSIIAIEDFDASECLSKRSSNKTEKDEKGTACIGVSLSGFLNTLDGVIPLDDTIIILTTNHLDSVDPAIYRKGRVDNVIHIGDVPAESIKEYSLKQFPDEPFHEADFVDSRGCLIHEAIRECKGEGKTYMKSLINSGVCKLK